MPLPSLPSFLSFLHSGEPRIASYLREIIAHKDAEIAYLRSQIVALQRVNVTLTNQHAARLLGYSVEPPPSPTNTVPAAPSILRNAEAPPPDFSLDQLKTTMVEWRKRLDD